MARPLTILTGASRGMGLAMARQLIDAEHELLCISRRVSDELAEHAAAAGVPLEQWQQDLARPETAAARLEAWLGMRDPARHAEVALINNAGLLPRIAALGEISAADASEALRVDLEAPLLLAGAFLRATAAWTSTNRRAATA